jgi:hypothetical protein
MATYTYTVPGFHPAHLPLLKERLGQKKLRVQLVVKASDTSKLSVVCAPLSDNELRTLDGAVQEVKDEIAEAVAVEAARQAHALPPSSEPIARTLR